MDDSTARQLLRTARFAELPEHLAHELRARGQRRTYEKGAYVHAKGDPGDGLFGVVRGRIRVSTVSREGQELVVTDLEPGAFFGEVSLFDELPRTHDAYALVRSELVFVAKREFELLLESRPELAKHFLRGLALKLRMCMTALDGIALDDVSARLALRLFVLAKRRPAPEVSVSQTDLALMVGATRQSVNKTLKAWERAGVVRIDGRKLIILDDKALLALTKR